MHILQSWKDSLTVLKPESLKLFALVTLKSILETYKTLFTKFWWLIIGYIIIDLCMDSLASILAFPFIAMGGLLIDLNPFVWITDLGYVFLAYLIFMIARPSVDQKNWAYIKKYWCHAFYFFVINIIFTFISGNRFGLEIDDATGISYMLLPTFSFIRAVFLISPFIVTGPLYIFLNAFIFDTKASLNSVFLSCVRAVKMCIYNYPFCAIGFISLYYLNVMWDWLVFLFLRLLNIPIVQVVNGEYIILTSMHIIKYTSILFWPIPICFLINFYIKRLHEQFTVYFDYKGE